MLVEGIEVKFPYEPYESQKGYMAEVLKSIKESKHAMLESPTGTGKTLSLLCALLSWLHKERSCEIRSNTQLPRIIYCSRTHA